MPGRDGTGPDGKGPRTGRGLGHCKQDETKGEITRPVGRRRRAARQ